MSKGLEQCDKCDYFISVEEAYKQGRADVIDELMLKASETDMSDRDWKFLKEQAEQLKENKDGKSNKTL